MPELSKPIIAVIGVIISIAILFLAILGIMPFLQETISGVSEQVQFSASAGAATTKSGNRITKIVFTVTVQKLLGEGTYRLKNTGTGIVVINPNGQSVSRLVSFSGDLDFTSSAQFIATVSGSSLPPGTWVIVVRVYDTSNNLIQNLAINVPVS